MSTPGNRRRGQMQSRTMAFCGMTAALSIALMLLGAIIPIATYAAPLISAVLLLPVLVEFGRRHALITYAATALIALLLGMDKEAAFFYLFFAWYPIVKWQLDRIRKKPLRILVKLLLFNLAFAALYALLGLVMNMQAVLQEFSAMGLPLLFAFILLFNGCMLLYDRLLFPLLMIYEARIKPRLTFRR